MDWQKMCYIYTNAPKKMNPSDFVVDISGCERNGSSNIGWTVFYFPLYDGLC